ncbi:Uncharacterized protein dnm_045165 [Desulfonema magnum]|uniref:Uncharacterized protein n=1 Tax=Desulfonema magnum TaxID=45655 RepID=A0A975GP65_9BACT|nr:Uncharacterized protein dnm_045165 [Desulfonema magnum]
MGTAYLPKLRGNGMFVAQMVGFASLHPPYISAFLPKLRGSGMFVAILTTHNRSKKFSGPRRADRADGEKTRVFPAGVTSSGENPRFSPLSRAPPGNFSIC